MVRFLFILLCVGVLSSCSVNDVHVLKSPCVAKDSDDIYNSPCIRRPANANWVV